MVQRPARSNAGEAMSLFLLLHRGSLLFFLFLFSPSCAEREQTDKREDVNIEKRRKRLGGMSGRRRGEGIRKFVGLWMR